MKLFSLLIILFSALSAQALPPREPVLIDGDDFFDPCSIGVVLTTAEITDKFGRGRVVAPGSQVYMCDAQRTASGLYTGVVVGQHCDLESYQRQQIPYNGPCLSGWIRSDFLQVISP